MANLRPISQVLGFWDWDWDGTSQSQNPNFKANLTTFQGQFPGSFQKMPILPKMGQSLGILGCHAFVEKSFFVGS